MAKDNAAKLAEKEALKAAKQKKKDAKKAAKRNKKIKRIILLILITATVVFLEVKGYSDYIAEVLLVLLILAVAFVMLKIRAGKKRLSAKINAAKSKIQNKFRPVVQYQHRQTSKK